MEVSIATLGVIRQSQFHLQHFQQSNTKYNVFLVVSSGRYSNVYSIILISSLRGALRLKQFLKAPYNQVHVSLKGSLKETFHSPG